MIWKIIYYYTRNNAGFKIITVYVMNESPSENVLKLGSGCLYMTPIAYFLF